ncbi:ribonuclease H protein, partial [Trifolium medium]|nr:ribonuclease H protein [Trifolium medium]
YRVIGMKFSLLIVTNLRQDTSDAHKVGNPGQAAYAGDFRNRHGEHMGSFAMSLGIANALYAEIMGVILAIEFAVEKHESDSRLATLAIKYPMIVHWQIKNRCLNCPSKISFMQFIISHIYREDNHCADKLASLS